MRWWPFAALGVLAAAAAAWWSRREVSGVVESVSEQASNASSYVSAAVQGGAPVYWLRGTSRDDLHPMAATFFAEWERSGPFALKVTSTGRTEAQQAEEYAKGRTAPGAKVTNAATARDTAHGWRLFADERVSCAFDVYPANGPNSIELNTSDARWPVLIAAMRAAGFKVGADFTSLKDFPHAEVPGWQSLAFIG